MGGDWGSSGGGWGSSGGGGSWGASGGGSNRGDASYDVRNNRRHDFRSGGLLSSMGGKGDGGKGGKHSTGWGHSGSTGRTPYHKMRDDDEWAQSDRPLTNAGLRGSHGMGKGTFGWSAGANPDGKYGSKGGKTTSDPFANFDAAKRTRDDRGGGPWMPPGASGGPSDPRFGGIGKFGQGGGKGGSYGPSAYSMEGHVRPGFGGTMRWSAETDQLSNSVFVENVPPLFNETSVRNVFRSCGEIRSLSLHAIPVVPGFNDEARAAREAKDKSKSAKSANKGDGESSSSSDSEAYLDSDEERTTKETAEEQKARLEKRAEEKKKSKDFLIDHAKDSDADKERKVALWKAYEQRKKARFARRNRVTWGTYAQINFAANLGSERAQTLTHALKVSVQNETMGDKAEREYVLKVSLDDPSVPAEEAYRRWKRRYHATQIVQVKKQYRETDPEVLIQSKFEEREAERRSAIMAGDPEHLIPPELTVEEAAAEVELELKEEEEERRRSAELVAQRGLEQKALEQLEQESVLRGLDPDDPMHGSAADSMTSKDPVNAGMSAGAVVSKAGSVSAPASPEDESPAEGLSSAVPKAGGLQPLPKAGGLQPLPKAGGLKPLPKAGGLKPLPKAGAKSAPSTDGAPESKDGVAEPPAPADAAKQPESDKKDEALVKTNPLTSQGLAALGGIAESHREDDLRSMVSSASRRTLKSNRSAGGRRGLSSTFVNEDADAGLIKESTIGELEEIGAAALNEKSNTLDSSIVMKAPTGQGLLPPPGGGTYSEDMPIVASAKEYAQNPVVEQETLRLQRTVLIGNLPCPEDFGVPALMRFVDLACGECGAPPMTAHRFASRQVPNLDPSLKTSEGFGKMKIEYYAVVEFQTVGGASLLMKRSVHEVEERILATAAADFRISRRRGLEFLGFARRKWQRHRESLAKDKQRRINQLRKEGRPAPTDEKDPDFGKVPAIPAEEYHGPAGLVRAMAEVDEEMARERAESDKKLFARIKSRGSKDAKTGSKDDINSITLSGKRLIYVESSRKHVKKYRAKDQLTDHLASSKSDREKAAKNKAAAATGGYAFGEKEKTGTEKTGGKRDSTGGDGGVSPASKRAKTDSADKEKASAKDSGANANGKAPTDRKNSKSDGSASASSSTASASGTKSRAWDSKDKDASKKKSSKDEDDDAAAEKMYLEERLKQRAGKKTSSSKDSASAWGSSGSGAGSWGSSSSSGGAWGSSASGAGGSAGASSWGSTGSSSGGAWGKGGTSSATAWGSTSSSASGASSSGWGSSSGGSWGASSGGGSWGR